MKTEEKVTLYIPAYNGASYIDECINGVLSMARKPDELLVIDDGSTDDTGEIAEKLGAKVIRHSENKGIGAARNTALKAASHELVAHIDSDAVPEPDWLGKLMDGLDDNVVGVGGKLIEKNQGDTVNRWRAVQMAQHWGNEVIMDPVFLHGSGALYRKSALLKVGGYNERCRRNFEDNDMGLRLREAGYHIKYIPEAVSCHLRKDTLGSLLMTNWGWSRRPRDGTSLNYKTRKVLVNFWTLGRKIPRDIEERSVKLFGLSLLVTAHNTFMDLRYFLTGREDAWWQTRQK